MPSIRSGFAAGVLLFCPLLTVAGEVRRWVDDNGVVHYSDAMSIPEKYRGSDTRVQVKEAPGAEPEKASVVLDIRGAVAKVPTRLNSSLTTNLIVDTGASMTVISRALARELGIDIENGAYPMASFRTANGVVRAPIITLESIEVGGMRMQGLQASVQDIAPDVSGLLGLNFLSHFRMDIDHKSGYLHLERKP
jgi:clan AA aspartic protease (TIGR02281 family)